MEPLYTLLMCIPAALALIACGCGLAILWPPAARPCDAPRSAGSVVEGLSLQQKGGDTVHLIRAGKCCIKRLGVLGALVITPHLG